MRVSGFHLILQEFFETMKLKQEKFLIRLVKFVERIKSLENLVTIYFLVKSVVH